MIGLYPNLDDLTRFIDGYMATTVETASIYGRACEDVFSRIFCHKLWNRQVANASL